MSIEIKSIVCPQCGSTEVKQMKNGKYKCDFCDSSFMVESKTGDFETFLKKGQNYLKNMDYDLAKKAFTNALEIKGDSEIAKMGQTCATNKTRILKKDISTEDAKKAAFEYVFKQDKLVPDFFSKISVLSCEEKYYFILVKSGLYDGTASAVSCYRNYRDVYNPKTQKTEKKEYIEKMPFNGVFSTAAIGAYGSGDLCKTLTGNDITKYSKLFYNDNNIISELFLETERAIEKELGTFASAAEYFDLDLYSEDKYDGLELEMTYSGESIDRVIKQYNELSNHNCKSAAEISCPGDFVENLQYVVSNKDETTETYYVPFQIIKCKYKNAEYKIVQVMNKGYNYIFATYPANKTSLSNENKIQMRVNEINNKVNQYEGRTSLSVVIGIITSIGICGVLFFNGEFINDLGELLGVLLFVFLPFGITACIFNAIGRKVKEKGTKEINELMQKESNNQKELKSILKKSYNAFKGQIEKDGDIKAASVAAKNRLSSNDNYSFTGCCSEYMILK